MSYKFLLAAVLIGLVGFAYTAERPRSDAREAAATGAPKETMHAAMPMQPGDPLNSPLHRQIVNIFVLPEMQSELGLSAQQMAELRRLKKDLLAKSKDIAGQTATRRKELDFLLSGDTSRTRVVRTLFDKIADLHAQLQYAGFDTAMKMKALLNDSQRAKFNAMKPADVHRLAMSRANMAEMEEMMQRMGVGESMGQMEAMPGSHAAMIHGASGPAN